MRRLTEPYQSCRQTSLHHLHKYLGRIYWSHQAWTLYQGILKNIEEKISSRGFASCVDVVRVGQARRETEWKHFDWGPRKCYFITTTNRTIPCVILRLPCVFCVGFLCSPLSFTILRPWVNCLVICSIVLHTWCDHSRARPLASPLILTSNELSSSRGRVTSHC